MIARTLLLLLVLIGSSHGCALNRGTIGDDIKPESIAAIQKGVSRTADVLAYLGAPDRILQINGRDVFQYYRYDAKAGSLLLILINFSRVSVKSDDVFVLLNREGVVEDVIASRRTQGMEFRFWPFGE